MRSGMGTWNKRKIEKKNRGSQTPGKSKVESCQADVMKKYMAKRSRSYKHSGYADWCKRMDSLNLGARMGEK